MMLNVSIVHVSITGLRLKAWWHAPRFAFHTLRALRQARQDPDCLKVEARKIDGVYHTLTVWRSRPAMRAYVGRGAHRAAMQAFRAIGTGKVFGYGTDVIPEFEAAYAMWQAHAREV
jgi:hypothetical protein